MNPSMFHPMIVHFPVALLLTGFLFIALEWVTPKNRQRTCSPQEKPSFFFRAAQWMFGLGLLAGVAALATGAIFTSPMEGLMGQFRTEHMRFALLSCTAALLTFTTMLVFVRKMRNFGGYLFVTVCASLTALLIAYTGHLGGSLVFGL